MFQYHFTANKKGTSRCSALTAPQIIAHAPRYDDTKVLLKFTNIPPPEGYEDCHHGVGGGGGGGGCEAAIPSPTRILPRCRA
jgi:hypothetical protein